MASMSTAMGSVSTMPDFFSPTPLPEEHVDLWKQYAVSARATEFMLNTHVDPRRDSQLDEVDRRYKWERSRRGPAATSGRQPNSSAHGLTS